MLLFINLDNFFNNILTHNIKTNTGDQSYKATFETLFQNTKYVKFNY